MQNPRADQFDLQQLERRLFLSVAPAVASLAPVASRVTSVQPLKAAPALSLSDRQELLANWVGSDKATLTTLLNANNTAGFDNELLNYMRTRTNRHYFFDTSDATGILNFINGDSGLVNQKNARIAKADKILAHLFPDAVNSSTYTIQLPVGTVDWLNQPSTSSNTEFLYTLNRHFYWNDLAMAYRFTGDAKYVTELKNQLDSWSRQYTRLAKPDDWISQTVRPKWDLYTTSERVKNWVSAYYMVLSTSGWTAASNTVFLHRLLVQGDFMSRTTKTYELTSNKATGHGTALYELGMLFPEFKNGAAWQAQGANLLFKAIDAQFRGDGGHYEQSPSYHGGAMMSYLDAFQLASKNGLDWADKSARKLRKIFDFYFQLLSPDGTQAALSDTYRSQGTTLFSGASILLGQPQWPKSRPRLDDVWQLGTAASTPLLSAPTVPPLTGRGPVAYYADSGYYATRSGEDRDARQLIFDAGPKGDIHGHYDLLNFELYGYQHPLIADPGLLSYSKSYAADRATVISTPAHNTISVDGLNHAASEKSTVATLTLWNRKADSVQMAATHYAYAGFKGAPVVARNIWHDRNDVFLVVDFASASATHTYTQSFNLFTNNTTKFSGGVIRTKAGSGDVLLQPLLLGGQTTSAKNAILSNSVPPAGTATGLRFAISATARSTVFATLVVAYDNGVVPSVSAKWIKMPSATRSGQIEVNKNGVKTIVYFPMPNLTPVAGAASVKRSVATANTPAPAAAAALAAPPTPFAFTTPIRTMNDDLFNSGS